MEFAFEYLKNELEQLINELKETEKKIEFLENTLDFSSGVVDPRYKRLTDKYANLNTNACSLRMKMAELVASCTGDSLKQLSSSNASVSSSSSSSGAKRKSSALTSNQIASLAENSVVANDLSSNDTHQDVRSLSHMIAFSSGDQITGVIDQPPNNASNSSSSFTTTQVDNRLVGENRLPDSSFARSANILPSFSTINTNNNNNNFDSANNSAANSAWPTFQQTIFRNVAPVVQSQAAPSTSFPMTVGAPLHHPNKQNTGTSPFIGLGGSNGNVSHQDSFFSSSSSLGNTTTDPKSFVSADDIVTAKSVSSPFFNNHSLSPPAAPRLTCELEASMLQTDDYVDMKKTVAKIMKLFHEKKLHFMALDGSPIYAQQYQAISLRVKQGEKITDFIRGQMLSYVTGIDKKKQTISKTDLFLPDYQPIL